MSSIPQSGNTRQCDDGHAALGTGCAINKVKLAADTARIGVATSELYPAFTLSGFLGFESLDSRELLTRKSRATGRPEQVQAPPIWSGHADYINPFEFISFLRGAAGLRAFDVMLETKLKDLALIQLRKDLARYAPDLSEYS